MHGALDYSGGYVIHLSAGISGFVAAAVIGPRLQRDREIDAPNNMAMVAVGAGSPVARLERLQRRRPVCRQPVGRCRNPEHEPGDRGRVPAVWVALDYLTGRKPSLIGGVNGIITGLVAITPAAGFVNGWGAIAIGVIACVVVYVAMNYLSRMRPFRNVDDTLGVVYTHGFAGLTGGLLVGVFADPHMGPFDAISYSTASSTAAATLLKWQFFAAAWVIVWSGAVTFILLKLVGVFIPLRMSTENMEIGDVAEHGHEVYPSDIPSLAYPDGVPSAAGAPTPA